MDARTALTAPALLLAALVAAAPAMADKPMGPVPGEAVSLPEPARSVAVHVQRAHLDAFLAAFSTFTLEGVQWSDPARPARCDIHVSIDPAALPPGSFVDGMPVRRAQPLWFNEFQRQLVRGVSECASVGKLAVTAGTLRGVRDRSLDLLAALSGTTYCLEDADCSLVTADPSGCGGRAPLLLAGSATTDFVLFVAFRKFLPAFFSQLESLRAGAAGELGARHPDAKAGAPACGRPSWKEEPMEAVCRANRCRPAPKRPS